ncbi:MAG TPA: SpoIIE family protein phosphatase [Spirochaetota bacterium]|nr:SpoIIE family protein phosphatase [Spirochaetota bacterium]HPS86716.1 SpoIIE family protein phosphatase [Spirochaetota bacterium]
MKEDPSKNKPVHRKIRFGISLKFSLAIISLVSVIILTISVFIVYRESGLLKEQVFNFTKREIVHLGNTAQQTIGYEELTLSDAINELKKIGYYKYVFVLGSNNEVLYYFDRRGADGDVQHEERKQFNDSIIRTLEGRSDPDSIDVIDYKDEPSGGIIYDFSKIVYSRADSKIKAGVVIIGMSDIVIRSEIANIKRLIMFIFFGYLAISILGAVVLSMIIIRPIKKISHGASVIGQGDFSYRIELNSSDELGMLAAEFNQMTEMIQNSKEKEIETRIMNEQLEIARDIQEGLNPMGYYNKNGIQIKGSTKAAKGVGGDYFDYIDIDDDRVCALISDVSGKGVPASLVMVMIRTVFTSYISRKDIDCASVVTAINDSLSADFAIDKFATLFFMIYNRATEELSFSNAGHGPLFCYRAAENACTRTSLDGVPIGIMEEVEYKQAKVKFHPGDMVVLYTDGITEMRNANKEEYGLPRVHRLLMNNHNLSAAEFLELLINDVEMFRGDTPPHDDTTAMVFKREK